MVTKFIQSDQIQFTQIRFTQIQFTQKISDQIHPNPIGLDWIGPWIIKKRISSSPLLHAQRYEKVKDHACFTRQISDNVDRFDKPSIKWIVKGRIFEIYINTN